MPMAEKDQWNSRPPKRDARYTKYVNKPELAGLLPVLYPGAFPNLAAYKKPRADLNAILMTGIPEGVVPGFQNFTGPVAGRHAPAQRRDPADRDPNDLGLVAGDAAGFPNGRRMDDDVVTIELRAVAGLTIPLVDPSFTPDGAAGAVTDGTTNTNAARHRQLPVPGAARWRLPDRARHHAGVDDRRRRWRTRTPGRARSCSTSVATSGRWWSPCRPTWSVRRSRSSPPTRWGTS